MRPVRIEVNNVKQFTGQGNLIVIFYVLKFFGENLVKIDENPS